MNTLKPHSGMPSWGLNFCLNMIVCWTLVAHKNEKARSINRIVCSMIQEPEHIKTAKVGEEGMVYHMLQDADKLTGKERDAAVALLLEFKDVRAMNED